MNKEVREHADLRWKPSPTNKADKRSEIYVTIIAVASLETCRFYLKKRDKGSLFRIV